MSADDFGSEEWARTVVEEIKNKGWAGFDDEREAVYKEVISGICNCKYNPVTLNAALESMSDAAMVIDMLRSDHPLLHELAHQVIDLNIPQTANTAEEFKKLTDSVPWRYLDSESRRSQPRFGRMVESSSEEVENPPPSKERILSASKEIQRKASANNSIFRCVMTNARMNRFAKARWYRDQYGNMVHKRIKPTEDGWIREFISEVLGARVSTGNSSYCVKGINLYNLAQTVKYQYRNWDTYLIKYLTQ